MPLLTQKAYAKHRKVTPQYVNKLVRTRRIPVNRRGLINLKRADAALRATRRLGRVAVSKRPPSRGASHPSDTTTLTGWRAQTEEYKAKQAKLEYERTLGRLLPASEILEAERRKNSNIRTRLRRIARILAPRLKAVAATASTAEIELMVLEQIEDALGEAADKLAEWIAAGEPLAAPAGEELQTIATEIPLAAIAALEVTA